MSVQAGHECEQVGDYTGSSQDFACLSAQNRDAILIIYRIQGVLKVMHIPDHTHMHSS